MTELEVIKEQLELLDQQVKWQTRQWQVFQENHGTAMTRISTAIKGLVDRVDQLEAAK